jgi:hypothetical protein
MVIFRAMMQNKPLTVTRKKRTWSPTSPSGHFVQFYQSESSLLLPLTKFLSSGLAKGESCIVIATQAHVQSLAEQLQRRGVDVLAAQSSGQYIALDAAETLAKFMVSGLPDRGRFFKIVGALIQRVTQKDTPIRAYGEMVALLWKAGNKQAVIQLENLWNELAESHAFSLYCAYPDLHFILDSDVRDEICECHSAKLSSMATA